MTPLVAGIDLSTKALHACLIPLDPDITLDPILRVAKIEQADGKAERLRNVSKAMHDLLRDPLNQGWLTMSSGFEHEVVSVWIEKPPIFGRKAGRDELLQVYGAACASVPWRVTAVAGIDPQEWRRTLGLVKGDDWKGASIAHTWDEFGIDVDQHHADAACIALAGRSITWKHDRSVNA